MRRQLTRASAVLLLLVFGIALAQPTIGEFHSLTLISNGVNSTHTTAQELVITNTADYSTFFGGSPPLTPTVNFTSEDVLAVTMGTQPTGSSITITGLDIRTTGFTAGWGFVHVSSVVGSGSGTTQPFSVVKVAKGALTYAFLKNVTPIPSTGPTPFSELCYTTGGGRAPFNESIMIDGIGTVFINRSTGTTGGTTYFGSLTATESQALNTAFVNANPASLPGTIFDTTPTTLTDIPLETVSSTIGSAEYTSVIARAGFYGGSSTIKSLIDAIRRPAERIVRSTPTLDYLGHVNVTGSGLQVGGFIIDPTDPFHDLIATAVGNSAAFDGFDRRTANSVVSFNPKITAVLGSPHLHQPVISVDGTLTVDQPLLSFPSAGADATVTLPAGTQLDVTNLTLSGNYFEVESGGQRGFVLASAVSIIR